jgi:hypothetical protein
MDPAMWFFIPLASIVVFAILLGLGMWIKDAIDKQGLTATLFVIFFIIAIASAFIGLFFLDETGG